MPEQYVKLNMSNYRLTSGEMNFYLDGESEPRASISIPEDLYSRTIKRPAFGDEYDIVFKNVLLDTGGMTLFPPEFKYILNLGDGKLKRGSALGITFFDETYDKEIRVQISDGKDSVCAALPYINIFYFGVKIDGRLDVISKLEEKFEEEFKAPLSFSPEIKRYCRLDLRPRIYGNREFDICELVDLSDLDEKQIDFVQGYQPRFQSAGRGATVIDLLEKLILGSDILAQFEITFRGRQVKISEHADNNNKKNQNQELNR